MTIQFNESFYAIDKVYSVKYGLNWIEKIGADKYLDILDKYKALSAEDKKAFEKGDLIF